MECELHHVYMTVNDAGKETSSVIVSHRSLSTVPRALFADHNLFPPCLPSLVREDSQDPCPRVCLGCQSRSHAEQIRSSLIRTAPGRVEDGQARATCASLSLGRHHLRPNYAGHGDTASQVRRGEGEGELPGSALKRGPDLSSFHLGPDGTPLNSFSGSR